PRFNGRAPKPALFFCPSSTMPPTFAWGFSDVHSGAGSSNWLVDRLGHLEKRLAIAELWTRHCINWRFLRRCGGRLRLTYRVFEPLALVVWATGTLMRSRKMSGLGNEAEEALRMACENVHFEPAGNARFGRIFNPFGKTKNARRNLSMTARARALLEMVWNNKGDRRPDGCVPVLSHEDWTP